MNDTQRIQAMNIDELREQVATLVRSQGESKAVADSLSKLLPWFKVILAGGISGAVAIAVWVTTIEYRQQYLLDESEDHDGQLHAINAWKIQTDSNRFTSKDASEMMNSLMSAAAVQDKRLQRVEDSNLVIKESLQRIESKLQ